MAIRNQGWAYVSSSTTSGTPGGADTNIQFNNAGALDGSSDLTWDGSTVATTDISASINISASAFYGDGSNLTGVTASAVNVADGPEQAIQFRVDTPVSGEISGSSALMFLTGSNTLSGTYAAFTAVTASTIVGGSPLTISSSTTQVYGPMQIQSGDSLSFNGSTNTAKITNNGSNLDFNSPGSIVLNSGNNNVSSSANISASAFYGDGSNLTGIASGAGLVTAINGTQAYLTSSLAIGGSSAPDHTLSISGSMSASINVSASAFYGDGSNLTGVTASAVNVADGPEYAIQWRYDTPASGDLSGSQALTWNTSSLDLAVIGNVRLAESYEFYGDLEGAVRFPAVNDEGDAISKGQAIYIKGISGQTPTVALAACDDINKMPAFGLAGENAANGAAVQIVTFGSLKNLNLTSIYGQTFAVGDTAYIQTGSGGTSGSLTPTRPTGNSNFIQNMGEIVRNGGGGDGQIKITGPGRANATPNLDKGYLFVGNDTNCSVQDNTVFISSSANLVGINNTNPDHALSVTGDISASVNVSASAFYGDGSALTNLPAGGIFTELDSSNAYSTSSLSIGTSDAPAYALDVNGHIALGTSGTGYLINNGDTNTYIQLGGAEPPGVDGMSFIVGGKRMFMLDENASVDSVTLGNATADLIIVSGSLIVSGSISGSTTIQGASLSVDGAVTAGSLTDGTATISAGAITGGTSYSGSTTIQGASLSVSGSSTAGGLQILDGSGGLIFSASAGASYAGLAGNGVVSRRTVTISGSSDTGLLVDSTFNGGVGIGTIGIILAGHTGGGAHTARLHSDGSISGSAGLTMGTTGVFGSDVGIRTTTPTEALDINSDAIRIRTAQTPASAAATGTAGMVCWDSNYIYVCIATDTWKRVAIGTW
tara:strand:- start:62 stop:2710 length:2649 start_codon:yes stop_codon:yes gene_type:complete